MITSIFNRLQKFIILFSVIAVFFINFVLGVSRADASIDFDFSAQYQVGQRPLASISSDFDNDGDIDLATANDANSNISILLNDGSGVFNIDSTVAIAGEFPQSIDVADFDNDGDVDLVVSNRSSDHKVTILLNSGVGTFTVGSILIAEGIPQTVITADLDNDNDIDLVSSNINGSKITVFLNNGLGIFTVNSKPIVTASSYGINAADIDGDNDNDLIVVLTDANKLAVLKNEGNAIFALAEVISIGSSPLHVKAADFDDDGDVDLATVNNQSHSVSILLNNGNGAFTNESAVELGLGSYPNSFVITDIDTNGSPDIVTVDGGTRRLSLILNDGTGTFSIDSTIPIGDTLHSPQSITADDFDEDGDIDLAIGYGYINWYMAILLQVGSPNTAPILNPVGNQVVSENQTLTMMLSADDLDGDTLTYSASNLPPGAVFDIATGNFYWTPGYDDSGVYRVTFIVSDGILSDSELIEINVLDTNRAPVLNDIGNKVVAEGESLEFAVSATDLDGDNVTYSASNLPAGSTFDLHTGVFTWTLDFTQSGNYTDIEFTVTDDGVPMQPDTELITITVGDVNRPPVFEAISSKQVLENELLTFNVVATDSDGDIVTLSLSDTPPGSTFTPSTRVFSWTPTLSQEGVYVVTFVATDNGSPEEMTSLEVVITVGDNPTPTEQAENLVTSVITFDIPQNIENSYLANLQKVALFIEEGKVQAAINQLQAFSNKLAQDYQSGRISEQLYGSLLIAANSLLENLEGN